MCGKFHTPLQMVHAWVVIIGVKVDYRQTDRQTNSLTPYTRVCGFFLSVKFATPYLLRSQGYEYDKELPSWYDHYLI